MPRSKERHTKPVSAQLPEDGPVPLQEFELGVIYAKINPYENSSDQTKLGKATLVTDFRPLEACPYTKRATNAWGARGFPAKLQQAVMDVLVANFGEENVKAYSFSGGLIALSGEDQRREVYGLFKRSTVHVDAENNVTIDVAAIGQDKAPDVSAAAR